MSCSFHADPEFVQREPTSPLVATLFHLAWGEKVFRGELFLGARRVGRGRPGQTALRPFLWNQ